MFSRNPVPWWNDKVKTANRDKKHAFNYFKRHSTLENPIAFKKLRVKERKIKLDSKRSSWEKFVSSLNPSTSSQEVCSKIRAIAGKRKYSRIAILSRVGKIISELREIANIFGSHYARVSGSEIYMERFLRLRAECEV